MPRWKPGPTACRRCSPRSATCRKASSTGAAIAIEPNELAIANGLRRLTGMTDDERRAMGDRGRALVANRFSWSVVAVELEAVYRWLLGLQAPPGTVDIT